LLKVQFLLRAIGVPVRGVETRGGFQGKYNGVAPC
jgi:hypothetical protein